MKFAAGVLFLILALILQFWFASANLVIDFVFTTLVVFGLIYDFWEVVFFVLLSLFIVNWQPVASITIVTFGLIPLLVNGARRLVPWQAWAGNLAAITAGLLVLYLSVSPSLLLANRGVFFIDLIASLMFGSLVFFGLRYSPRR